MSNKDISFKQAVKGKGFYFLTALAFLVVAGSVVISYYTTGRIDNKATDITQTETLFSMQAEAPQTNIPDERDFEEDPFNEETEVTTQEIGQSAMSSEAATENTTVAEFVNREFVLPTDGAVIKWFSSASQQYSKTMGDWRVHLGVDFACKEGDLIYSVGNGKVTKVIADTKWGYTVEVDYGQFTARYCGLSQEGAVGIDEKLSAGELIGEIGTIPCEALDGAHLHLEVVKDGVNVDPVKMLGAF